MWRTRYASNCASDERYRNAVPRAPLPPRRCSVISKIMAYARRTAQCVRRPPTDEYKHRTATKLKLLRTLGVRLTLCERCMIKEARRSPKTLQRHRQNNCVRLAYAYKTLSPTVTRTQQILTQNCELCCNILRAWAAL